LKSVAIDWMALAWVTMARIACSGSVSEAATAARTIFSAWLIFCW
jgi:hypothetical protein